MTAAALSTAPTPTNRGAVFSGDRLHRYVLWRLWNARVPGETHLPRYAMVIGLNPSTADEQHDDPTVRRCINYAKSWGYDGLVMTNLFAYRATNPHVMFGAADPIGPENDDWLVQLAQNAALVVAAWGVHGTFRGRAAHVTRLLAPHAPLHCISTTRAQQPGHPLYLRGDLVPRPYLSPAETPV